VERSQPRSQQLGVQLRHHRPRDVRPGLLYPSDVGRTIHAADQPGQGGEAAWGAGKQRVRHEQARDADL